MGLQEKYIEDGAFSNVDTIVHLAGAGVADKRWSADRKEEILKAEQKQRLCFSKA